MYIPQIEPSLGKEEKRELLAVLESGWYVEATRTKQLEKMFADFVGSKFACTVTSGTIGLFIALKSLGIGKGDEVIVPDLTFVASPNAVEMTGAKPVIIDIESKSLNLDLDKLQNLISKKTKAIMPVHFNGRSTNMNKLKEITKKNGLRLVEDAAHAIGCFHQKKHLGTIGDAGVFSFSIPKIITTGQGGMIVTNDKKVYEKCVSLKDFGREIGAKKDMRKAFDHPMIGYNFKFTEFQAAVGIAQMKKLPKRIARKKSMLKMYMDLLSDIHELEFIKTNFDKVTP